jgi:hypothetical protein
MALSGALADLGVVDLVQFPSTGRKTGELVIADASSGQEAHLFYAKGKLVHAALGREKGLPVLVEVLGWSDGRFEFEAEVAAPEVSIESDLHRAMMQALKIRDELSEEARRSAEQAPAAVFEDALRHFVEGSSWALYAGVLGADGRVLAQVSPGRPPQGLDGLRASMHALSSAYPRRALRRIFAEDEEGAVVLVRLASGASLLVVAGKGAATGVVSVGVGKLAASLESERRR